MQRSHLLGLFVIVAVIALQTVAITQTIKYNQPTVVVKEVVVTPSASPSAVISPTVAGQNVRQNRTVVSPTLLPKTTGTVK